MPTPLPTITTLARAGALARAEALFAEGGYDSATNDPAALAVKGRLTKDRGLLASGGERARLFKEAAACYASADALATAPYLLINVATLTLLAGDAKRASDIAAVVLERLGKKGVAETPYWLAATRAEARLLRGTVPGAREALAEAVGIDPKGWDDHACTLHQLGLVLDAQGLSKDWLDPFRPPRSLHFAGHLGIAPDDPGKLKEEVAAFVAEERIGFAWGALAAGADIIIAEALLEAGVALHVVLPTTEKAFIAQSITPYDPAWLTRFHTCLDAATSRIEATRIAGGYEPNATALAADMAMGGALLNARALESSALQLLVIDEGDGLYGDGAYTARDGTAWAAAGHRQRMIRHPRDNGVAASAWKKEGRTDRRLAALIHVSLDGVDALDDWAFAHVLDSALAPWWETMTALSGRARTLNAGAMPGFLPSQTWQRRRASAWSLARLTRQRVSPRRSQAIMVWCTRFRAA